MDVLTVGDEITIEATVKEAYSVTELSNITDYTILSYTGDGTYTA